MCLLCDEMLADKALKTDRVLSFDLFGATVAMVLDRLKYMSKKGFLFIRYKSSLQDMFLLIQQTSMK